ncbi:unnamed protein product [Calypogeia fissa]
MEGVEKLVPVILAGAMAVVSMRIFPFSPSSKNGNRSVANHSDSGEEIGEVKEDSDDGSVKPVSVQWKNVTCVLVDKSGHLGKVVLNNVSGEAKAGRLLAIMGPSGSGKTSLINVLAGQLPESGRLRLTGRLSFNGLHFNSFVPKVAYVRQEDLFFSQLTVRETLSLAAELQLSNGIDKGRYVNDLLNRLGLGSCADTIVGDNKVRGISGGEKKRLSIACELIASPSVIFADEPTTGLDAFQAEQVMETLKQLAEEGHTVIASIHQPRGSIYAKFDDLVLLSEGSLVYAGAAGDDALSYFENIGYKVPEHVNPAEYFADMISIDYSSSEREDITRQKLASLVKAFSSKEIEISDAVIEDTTDEKESRALVPVSPRAKIGWWSQFRFLLKRAWLQATRDGPTNKVRASMSISSALIFGSIFWRMGLSQTSIQDRMGLLQVAAVNTAMAALTKTVNVFPKERTIVQRERTKGSYDLVPYLVSKVVAEAPISAAFPLAFGAIVYPLTRLHPSISRFLKFSGVMTIEAFAASALGLTVGAVSPTVEAASALGPSIMTVFIVFGGYYVNEDNTPIIFRWIPKISIIRWAFQALCINEFKGLKFDKARSFDVEDGEQVLDRLSFGKSTLGGAMLNEGGIATFWYYLTYLALKRTKPRYQAFETLPQPTPLAVVSKAIGKSPEQFSGDFVDGINQKTEEESSTEGLREHRSESKVEESS